MLARILVATCVVGNVSAFAQVPATHLVTINCPNLLHSLDWAVQVHQDLNTKKAFAYTGFGKWNKKGEFETKLGKPIQAEVKVENQTNNHANLTIALPHRAQAKVSVDFEASKLIGWAHLTYPLAANNPLGSLELKVTCVARRFTLPK